MLFIRTLSSVLSTMSCLYSVMQFSLQY